MVVNVTSFSKMIGKDVFTINGKYCGKVKDFKIDLDKFRVISLIVEVFRGTYLADILGGEKKGVVIPYSSVESVGDIIIIRNIFRGFESEKTEQA